jgi:Amt family ammonium transporter
LPLHGGATQLFRPQGQGDPLIVNSAPWLNTGDTTWQITAATLVGLMSVPGLVVLYGGAMQKRWSINSMMLTFATFSIVLVVWVLYAYKMGFGTPWFETLGKVSKSTGLPSHPGGFFQNFVGTPDPALSPSGEQSQGVIPLVGSTDFPTSALLYFQFVFAAITPILALGSVLGRVNFKAWVPFCALWITVVYTVDAFMLWGGGYFAQHGSLDYSGGYVIHLSAGITGFIAAWVIGPRLQRDREVDAPNNVAMVAVGAGLLWLGWNGFNGGDPYAASQAAAAAVLNTNLTTAVAFLTWVVLDYVTGRKPSLLGGVNGLITGLVAITPCAGYINGYGAIGLGVAAVCIVYFAMNYLSRFKPFSAVDDTLGVIYTHGFAGLAGGLMLGLLADPSMSVTYLTSMVHGKLQYMAHGSGSGLFYGGGLTLLKWQALAACWVIFWSGLCTFVLLKVVGLVIPLRMSQENMEIAEHGHEVYPSDVPSLAYPAGAAN